MSTERTNFTMIPRLVMESGLSVHAVRLYLEMRMTTGELKGGQCWKSTQTLAEGCRMAAGSVSKAKSELLSKGFIKNLGRIIGEKGNLRDTDTFLIVDIWPLNSEEHGGKASAKLKESPLQAPSPFPEAPCKPLGRSPDESERSPNERKRSPGETNKNPMNKNPEIRAHSASGVRVIGKIELMQMGYDYHEAEILALWNEKMTPLGWLPVDTFSEEVCDMLVIWNEDDCEEQDFDLAQATALFNKSDFPNPNRTPTFVRFMRDRFKHPLTSKV
jgi:hypothetical protein